MAVKNRIDKTTTDKVSMKFQGALTIADLREFIEACEDMYLPEESIITVWGDVRGIHQLGGESSIMATGVREVT